MTMERGLCMKHGDNLQIPLESVGTKVRFSTRIPTIPELEDTSLHIHMTSQNPWEPGKDR